MSIFDLLKKPVATSSELRSALVKIDVLDARRELDRLMAERADVLVQRDHKVLAAHDAKLAKAETEYQTVLAEQTALEQRLAETEAREREAEVMIARDRAEAEAAEVAKLLKTRYPKLSNELTQLLERLMAAEALVRTGNEKLVALGRPDERLPGVEQRVFKVPDQVWAPAFSIISTTTLRAFPEHAIKGWNCGN